MMKYKIDNIPVEFFDIKFIAKLENGETLDMTWLFKFKVLDVCNREFSVAMKKLFDENDNLPLSEIEEDAELHRDEIK